MNSPFLRNRNDEEYWVPLAIPSLHISSMFTNTGNAYNTNPKNEPEIRTPTRSTNVIPLTTITNVVWTTLSERDDIDITQPLQPHPGWAIGN